MTNEEAQNLFYFKIKHPEIVRWWDSTDFGFAASLRGYVLKHGSLTEGQMLAAKKCVEAAKRAVPAGIQVDDLALRRAMLKAISSGLKHPKIRCIVMDDVHQIHVVFSRCKGNGNVFYAHLFGDYSAKIENGILTEARDIPSPAYISWIKEALASLEESAILYGRLTGSCSCCGRLLTNPLSIHLGIGPVCRERFFL